MRSQAPSVWIGAAVVAALVGLAVATLCGHVGGAVQSRGAADIVMGVEDPAPGPDHSYSDWIDQALGKLAGDDGREQLNAAEDLSLVVPDGPERPKVLAGLRPYLMSDDKNLRCRAVAAFAHWATRAEVNDLLKVVGSPPHPPTMSGDAPAWASATAALACLQPAAAEACVRLRRDDFFYRTDLDNRFETLADGAGPAAGWACKLKVELEPGFAAEQMPVTTAMGLLQGGSADGRVKGAKALSTAIVEPGRRAAVLALLKPHVMGTNGRARLQFVKAYAHWATAADVQVLAAIAAFPETVSGISGHEDCWSAVTVALLRFDPEEAGKVIDARRGVVLYGMRVHNDLKAVAEGAGPSSAAASWLLDKLDGNARPIPPGFDPKSGVVPGEPSPARPRGTGIRV